jgi:calcium/proton exchanger cax
MSNGTTRDTTTTPNDPAAPRKGALAALKGLLPFLRPYGRQFVFAGIALCVAAGATLAIPYAFKQMIDHGFSASTGASGAANVNATFLALFGVAAVLAVATAATALVSEILVHSLDHFGKAVGLNEFFIAVVIVAIVGNAAEHGGAVVIARRGNTTLATEIAITSSMQVAVFVTPAVCLLSWIVGRGLPLSFRVVEVATMAAAALFAAIVVADGKSRRWEGFLLIGVYAAAVVWYLLA